MDLDRFKQCSAAFGAERRRWPQREHALYDRFANTPEGMAILAEAGRTDRFLAARATSGHWPGPLGVALASRRQPWRRARRSALSSVTCSRTAPLTPVSSL